MKVKVVKWCRKNWTKPNLMYIYHKQNEIMQKNSMKQLNRPSSLISGCQEREKLLKAARFSNEWTDDNGDNGDNDDIGDNDDNGDDGEWMDWWVPNCRLAYYASKRSPCTDGARSITSVICILIIINYIIVFDHRPPFSYHHHLHGWPVLCQNLSDLHSAVKTLKITSNLPCRAVDPNSLSDNLHR